MGLLMDGAMQQAAQPGRQAVRLATPSRALLLQGFGEAALGRRNP
jgi:hypothetical protein